MKLFHTSDQVIVKPDIHHGRKNADFGWGFYLTPDRSFTYRWAFKDAVVNEYELDLSSLNVHSFTRSEAWVQYIFNNRQVKDLLDADVIIGPIANDTIFDTMGIIASGLLKPEATLQLLRIGPEYTQVAIKSFKAVEQLRWISSTMVTDFEKHQELLQAEKDHYEQMFATEMEKIANG